MKLSPGTGAIHLFIHFIKHETMIKSNVYKTSLIFTLAMFLTVCLNAQGIKCDPNEETNVLISDCVPSPTPSPSGMGAPQEVRDRYGSQQVPIPTSQNFPTLQQGTSACETDFNFEVTKSADDVANNLNSERAAWNQADDMAFLRGSNNKRLTFYNDQGQKWFAGSGSSSNSEVPFFEEDFIRDPLGNTVNPADIPPAWTDWKDNLAQIYWHPTENAIVYARRIYDDNTGIWTGELVQREVITGSSNMSLGTVEVLFAFEDYVIGNSKYKIAGGDGNDVNGGRLLLSLDDLSTTQEYDFFAVYDFTKKTHGGLVNAWFVSTSNPPNYQNYLESYIYYSASNPNPNFQSALFTLLYSGEPFFDYATVSASGLAIAAFFTKKDGLSATFPLGAYLFDLTGKSIIKDYSTKVLYEASSGHYDVGFYKTSTGALRECIVASVPISASTSTINDTKIDNFSNIQKGDIVAIYWDYHPLFAIATYSSWVSHDATAARILEWDPAGIAGGNSSLSGGQFSITSTVQYRQPSFYTPFKLKPYPFRALLSFGAAAPGTNLPPHAGEIVELSLDASDQAARRIIHHGISITNPPFPGNKVVEYQPEAWFSRNGDKLLFKSHAGLPGTPTSGLEQHLYFIKIPPRTCIAERTARKSRTEVQQQKSYSIFTNSLSDDHRIFVEIDDQAEEFQACLKLTAMDGRSISAWTGMTQAGHTIKVAVPGLVAGMYVAEFIDTRTNSIIQRSKLMLK